MRDVLELTTRARPSCFIFLYRVENTAYNETPTQKGREMQHVYSYCGSRLHLILEDEIAEGFNSFTSAFIDAQLNYKEFQGRLWSPGEPLYLEIDDRAKEGYYKVKRIIDLLVEINGGELAITEEDMTSDHLIRV